MSFLSIDGTAIVQLINFAIFFAILNMVFVRSVSRAIAKRRAYINSVTADYDRYQAEATALRAQAEGVRAAARRAAEQLLAKARGDASNAAARVSTEYSEQASDVVRAAQQTVAGELESARRQQPKTVRELADAIVRRALPELAR